MKDRLLSLLDRRKEVPAPAEEAPLIEDALEGEADCLAVLTMALTSRLPLLLHLDAGSGAARALSLRPMEISRRVLYAELVDKGVADADVRGRGGRCVFKLGQGSSDRFYAFETNVADTMMQPNGLRQIALTCPDKATFRRRRSMRFTPEEQDVQMLALWAAKRMKVGDETDLQKWGKPEFGLAEGKKGPVRVLDISSRGLGLDLVEKGVPDPTLLGKGRKFFVHLKIRGFDPSGPLKAWLLARIQKSVLSPDHQRREIGLQFIGQASMDEQGRFEWSKIPEHGVDSIGEWIFRRDLETCRLRIG